MKPGCLWISVSRLNSLMSNEVQALIKVFPQCWGIHNNTLIWEHTHPPRLPRMSCCRCLPQPLSLGGFSAPHQAAYTKPTTCGCSLVEKTEKRHSHSHRAPGNLHPQNSSSEEFARDFPTSDAARWALEPLAREGNVQLVIGRS